jgi:hypothetical protein
MTEHSLDSIDPLRLSRKQIVAIAEQLSRSYAWLHGDFPANYFTIGFDHMYDTLIYPKYGISLEEGDDLGEHNGEKVLGYYDANANTIALDSILNDKSDLVSAKKVFTSWHELGHALLHGSWLRAHPGRYADGRVITVESGILPETVDRFERQANLFASHAAVPQWFLDFVLESTFRLTRPIRYVGPARYWLEVWGCKKICPVSRFQELCVDIAYQIRRRFGGLSIEALSYRVRASRWVVDVTESVLPLSMPLLRTAPIQVGAALAAV